MKRRNLLRHAVLGGATTAIAACSQAATNGTNSNSLPRVNWMMAASWPTSLDTIYGGAQTIADRVSAMTNGRFTIEIYAAGELVPALQVLDAVQDGTIQCGHTASYYYIGKNPALGFATAMPFGLNAQQHNAWMYQAGGLELIHKIYAQFGIISFPAGNTGTQMGGWFKREIKTLADLQGLKMRIPGLGGEVMSRLGVNVQVLPGSEVFLALDRGAIDAAEWVGPYDDQKLGLNTAAPFYYYPGWWEPGATLDVLVNLNEWNNLPPEYQAAFKTATIESNMMMLARYDALNSKALKELVASGTQLRAYSPEILDAAKKASQELLEENASQDATFKEVYDQWSAFRDEVRAWNAVNELSFASYVTPPVAS
ncbi:MAG: TRAP transporter substrate-binding protein [Coleofasciculaceae cyanobacterium RL_1_1]|nr:TRAP transporter substrate-binding protein [Coleofasciculaceae cyanobacterium RL_1_1]